MWNWVQALDRQQNTAIHGKNDRDAPAAAKWLYKTVVEPMLAKAKRVDAGDATAMAWARKSGNFDPHHIVVPP